MDRRGFLGGIAGLVVVPKMASNMPTPAPSISGLNCVTNGSVLLSGPATLTISYMPYMPNMALRPEPFTRDLPFFRAVTKP